MQLQNLGVCLHFCKEQFSDVSHLIKHLKQHLDNDLSVTCPYKNCGKLFKVKSSFSAHLSRKHNKWTILDLADVREVCGVAGAEEDVEQDDVEASVTNYHSDAGEPEQEVVQDLVEFKRKYVDSIASFYLMLQGKYLVPVSTTGQIVDELTVSHELEQECSISLLKKTLNIYNINNQHINEIVDTFLQNEIFNITHRSDTGILLLFQIGCSVQSGTSDLPTTPCLIAFGKHLFVS